MSDNPGFCQVASHAEGGEEISLWSARDALVLKSLLT
jgi:hypothetical protein